MEGFTYLTRGQFSNLRQIRMIWISLEVTSQVRSALTQVCNTLTQVRNTFSMCNASVNLHWKPATSVQCLFYAQRRLPREQCLFADHFWRPSQCPNWARDSLLEILSSLLSRTSWIFQFGGHFPYQKSNLPRLVKMCKMRLPKCRVLLYSTFEGLPQFQIDLMIAHWKDIYV